MGERMKGAWNVGYTTRNHLCVDLDNASLPKVVGLAKMIMREYSYVGDCLIMLSSSPKNESNIHYCPDKGVRFIHKRHNFHLIFNNFISYELCCVIIETLAYLGVINEEYIRIREMRNDMTLRLSPTILTSGVKPSPKPLLCIRNPYTKVKGSMLLNYQAVYDAVNGLSPLHTV